MRRRPRVRVVARVDSVVVLRAVGLVVLRAVGLVELRVVLRAVAQVVLLAVHVRRGSNRCVAHRRHGNSCHRNVRKARLVRAFLPLPLIE
jgi:hypothetical protein